MKAIGVVLLILVLVVAGMAGYFLLFSGDLVKKGIEAFGPEYLGADVRVGSVDIDFVAGTGEIRGLVIGNPKDFAGPYAMSLDRIGLTLDVDQLSSELVVIKELLIEGASVAAVAVGKETNFQKLMENLQAKAGGEDDTAVAPSSEAGTKFIIDRFVFTDADVKLNSDILGESELSIPPIRIADVGRKSNGATAVEVGQQLIKPITDAISQAVVSQGLELEGVKTKLLEKVRDKVPGVDKITDLFK